MERIFKYVILGGGLAGVSAVEGIRTRDSEGSIALIGKEDSLPYNRPWLSKQLWTGKKTENKNLIREADFYASNKVSLFLGTEILSLKPNENLLKDAQGNLFRFERLLIATGGEPRVLDHDGGAVRYFRTRQDYLNLREAAGRLRDFLVVGGGFIGAELAAALSLNGKRVSMLFPDTFLLERVLPPDVAEFVTQYFRQKGITLWNSDLPAACQREKSGRVTVDTLGEMELAADHVVAGLGIQLRTRLAEEAGLKTEDGILVNGFLQTSVPSIYAAGDVTRFPCPALKLDWHVEHEDNAREQGRLAGMNMAGAGLSYTHLPYFYSDLFDLGFEAVGRLDSGMDVYAEWKTPFKEGVIYYLESDKVQGVLLWNTWNKVDAARQIIESGSAFPSREKLNGLLLEMAKAA